MKFKLDENFGIRTQQFLHALSKMPVEKRLWIVEISRIRVHQSEEDMGGEFEEDLE